MPDDLYVWQMSAIPDKGSVDNLRHLIIQHVRDSSPVSLSDVVKTIPITTSDMGQVIGRGLFTLLGNVFTNSVDDDTSIGFSDPVLKNFSLQVPATFSGSISVNVENVTLAFTTPVTLVIAELLRLGVGRSMYQVCTTVEITPDRAVTTLSDKTDASRKTQIHVSLTAADQVQAPVMRTSFQPAGGELPGGARAFLAAVHMASHFLMFDGMVQVCGTDSSGTLQPGGSTPPVLHDYYVWVSPDGVKSISESSPGKLWNKVFGPDTFQACQNYMNNSAH